LLTANFLLTCRFVLTSIDPDLSDTDDDELLGHLPPCTTFGKNPSLCAKVYVEIRRRLQMLNIDIPNLFQYPTLFSDVAPKFRLVAPRLLQEPIQVSDKQLKHLFELRESAIMSWSCSMFSLYERTYKVWRDSDDADKLLTKWE